jgi:hypothetical protein
MARSPSLPGWDMNMARLHRRALIAALGLLSGMLSAALLTVPHNIVG